MKKLTKRKGFNFLRSYFDVLNELENDKDKLDFLMSIINKQFLNEDPEDLNFIVNLCYESQRHQIESSVKGWERASNEPLVSASMTTPETTPPTPKQEEEVQEKEKEEEQEKGQDKKPKKTKAFSEDVLSTYYSVVGYFDESTQPSNNKQIDNWLETIDKLNRIDGLNFQDIHHLVERVRKDDFWSKNFLSITKLRKKNKEDIPYWKVFYNKFKDSNNTKSSIDYEQIAEIRRQHPDA